MLLCCRRQRWLILHQIEQSLLLSFSRTAVFIVLTTKGCRQINKYCFTRYADRTNNCAIIRVVFDLRWIDTTYIQTTMEILNDRIQCRKCI